MNYDEATPTPLKFLISNGDIVDQSGNVAGHSDSLEDMYIKASPQVKKFLLSDGSVVDENGNEIIKNDYFKKVYDQAEPKVAKYLHSDGTIDENPGSGSGANLQDNKAVSITSNGTTEITPDNGYDGMKKVTANVNVSGGIPDNLYAYDAFNDYDNFRILSPTKLTTASDSGDVVIYFATDEWHSGNPVESPKITVYMTKTVNQTGEVVFQFDHQFESQSESVTYTVKPFYA